MPVALAEDVALAQSELLTDTLGVKRGLEQISAFLDCFRNVSCLSGETESIVAENGARFEFSISSRDPTALRLLGEANEYGGTVIGNLAGNHRLIEQVTHLFDLPILTEFAILVRQLLPPGELLNQLQWKFSFYTAIRADGRSRPGFRCYFNLLWGSQEQRFMRVIQGLKRSGFGKFENYIYRVFGLLDHWAELVGISYDLRHEGIYPAKLHFSVNKKSRYKLELLRNWLELGDHASLMDWFLGAHPQQGDGAIPYLFSFDFGEDRPAALKIDMVLRGLSSRERMLLVLNTFERSGQSELGGIPMRAERDVFGNAGGATIQYIGVNFEATSRPYINCYFSGDRPAARRPTLSDWKLKALEAARRLQAETGGFQFESFDFGPRCRELPPGGGDVYMTALVEQSAKNLWPGKIDDVRQRCLSFLVRERREVGWCYLPGLPEDVDDTAMAMISLQEAGISIPDQIVSSLLLQQRRSGGFRTFYNLDSDSVHFAVTVNAVRALWGLVPDAVSRGVMYIEGWLRAPRSEELQWMYSPLLALYLLTRGSRFVGDGGEAFAEQIARIVMARRRDDGLWGNARGESLETALAILTLEACQNVPADVAAVADHLALSQCDDGTWPWAPIFSDGDGQWFGQRAVSTLLCGGALALVEG